MVQAIHYAFSQSFRVSARKAFEWCTDYTPEDHALMKEENAVREVQRISDDTVILTDKYFDEGKSSIKQKLVCLYPARFAWTSTHLAGPNKYSQFLYEISPQGSQRSRLRFTALHVDYQAKEIEETVQLRKLLLKLDSETWKHLAKLMENDFKRK